MALMVTDTLYTATVLTVYSMPLLIMETATFPLLGNACQYDGPYRPAAGKPTLDYFAGIMSTLISSSVRLLNAALKLRSMLVEITVPAES
jgi:hypothetical protein